MLCYLDNSATTQPRPDVIAAMETTMADGFFNPAALYAPGLQAEQRMDAARAALLSHLGTGTVVFTSGGTEANNLALLGHLHTRRGQGRVLYSAGEHPSVLEACRYAANLGYEPVEIPLLSDGCVDLEAFAALATEATALIAVMQVNNETGSIQPIDEIIRIRNLQCPEALLHVDGVQGFLRMPLRVSAEGVNTYALSGHKLHGPKGIGALVLAPGVRILPISYGGGQENNLRHGTPNTPGIAGLYQAVSGYPVQHDMRALKLLLYERLRADIPDLVINGPQPDSPQACDHILNVSFPPVLSETMLHALEGDQVYVGLGSACSSRKNTISHVLRAMGAEAKATACAIRFSLSPMTTKDEVLFAAERCAQHYRTLKRFVRR
jgi:cysteine desulfurase